MTFCSIVVAALSGLLLFLASPETKSDARALFFSTLVIPLIFFGGIVLVNIAAYLVAIFDWISERRRVRRRSKV